MKTSKTNLIAVLATVATLFVAGNALAGGGSRPKPLLNSAGLAIKASGNLTVLGTGTTKNANIGTAQKYGNGLGKALGNVNGLQNTINNINNRGINVTTVFGGTVKQGQPPKGCKPCHDGNCYREHRCGYTWEGRNCEVFYGEYIVVPGDTFETISMRLYGAGGNVLFLANFNRLPVNVILVPGQVLKMPSIETVSVL